MSSLWMTSRTGVWYGSVAWLVANTKTVVPLTACAGGRLGLVGTTRAAAHRLRLIIALSLPGRWVDLTISSPTTFSSVQIRILHRHLPCHLSVLCHGCATVDVTTMAAHAAATTQGPKNKRTG